jgi:hypothetical protein
MYVHQHTCSHPRPPQHIGLYKIHRYAFNLTFDEDDLSHLSAAAEHLASSPVNTDLDDDMNINEY